jgi:acyl-CoA reductase-like NAD-dependent aldehyde dehydrogenase
MIENWIDGARRAATGGVSFEKLNPHNGEVLYKVASSDYNDVGSAIASGIRAFSSWSEMTSIRRGQILSDIVLSMRENADELARLAALETGKSMADAKGDVGAAIAQGEYFASEGTRFFGRTLNSGMVNKYSHTVRQPHGVCGLIVPANTPTANIAWKIFPALICGNTAVLKASEDAPQLAFRIAELASKAGLPEGVLNVVQGRGDTAGTALVSDPRVPLISFTGSTNVGRSIAEVCGRRLARVSVELGGKNPFIVCDDADLTNAVHWAALSAFSNAGQRCAAGSRLLVAESIYDRFVEMLVAKASSFKLGVADGCDIGPVVSRRQHENILRSVDDACQSGGTLLVGGTTPSDPGLSRGFYITPALIADLDLTARLPHTEIFGPVATLHRFKDISEALALANGTDFGLTAAIHTRNVDRAMWLAQRVRAGSVNINIGTFGSEPHMPFGGFGASGNGTREPGIEALDVYSELKTISMLVRPELV